MNGSLVTEVAQASYWLISHQIFCAHKTLLLAYVYLVVWSFQLSLYFYFYKENLITTHPAPFLKWCLSYLVVLPSPPFPVHRLPFSSLTTPALVLQFLQLLNSLSFHPSFGEGELICGVVNGTEMEALLLWFFQLILRI